MYDDYDEFEEALHPYYGKGNFTKNMRLFQFIEEKEEE